MKEVVYGMKLGDSLAPVNTGALNTIVRSVCPTSFSNHGFFAKDKSGVLNNTVLSFLKQLHTYFTKKKWIVVADFGITTEDAMTTEEWKLHWSVENLGMMFRNLHLYLN